MRIWTESSGILPSAHKHNCHSENGEELDYPHPPGVSAWKKGKIGTDLRCSQEIRKAYIAAQLRQTEVCLVSFFSVRRSDRVYENVQYPDSEDETQTHQQYLEKRCRSQLGCKILVCGLLLYALWVAEDKEIEH